MAKYLEKHFKGQYRILANYDLSLKDFPRDEQGKIDSSFDDYYIPSTKYKLEIRHGTRNNLTCYCFSLTQLLNILYSMCKDLCGKNYQRQASHHELVCNTLINNSIITEYELLDGEGYFCFKTEDMSVIAPYLYLKTSGANISPVSKKNLPKSDYKITKEQDLSYKEVIHKDGFDKTVLMQIIKQANKDFDNSLNKKQLAEKNRNRLSTKQYASQNNLWKEYLICIENNINDYKQYMKNRKGNK